MRSAKPTISKPTAGYNGGEFERGYYRDYMTKNTLRFARCTLHRDGVDGQREGSRYLTLIPQGYPIESFPAEEAADFVCNDEEFWTM